MKYLSIDTETTGLSAKDHQLLEVSFILEDTNDIKPLDELPYLTLRIEYDEIHGEPYAINMNKSIIEEMSKRPKDRKWECIKPDEVFSSLWLWFSQVGLHPKYAGGHVTINAAGKNFNGFDRGFIEKILAQDETWDNQIRFRVRQIDPAILYVDWKNDEALPDLKTCKERNGLEGDVSHTSYEDALDVIKLLRPQYS